MRSVLWMLLAGMGLFSGTVMGLLGLQGRLNFAGTRGLPILETVFSKPDEEAPARSLDETVSDENALKGGDLGHQRLEGLGRKLPLPREVGPKVAREESLPGGRRPGDQTDTKSTQGSEAPDFRHQAESPMGQDQYRRGQLFRFPRLPSGMSVAEIDEMLVSAKDLRKELSRRMAALEQREAELSAREVDIQERGRAVLGKMREVLRQRRALEEEIASFEKTNTLVRTSEIAQYRSYGETLGSLFPEKSSQIILQMWRTEEGQNRAIKILKTMSREATDEIFSALSAEKAREILDRLTGAVIEETKR